MTISYTNNLAQLDVDGECVAFCQPQELESRVKENYPELGNSIEFGFALKNQPTKLIAEMLDYANSNLDEV